VQRDRDFEQNFETMPALIAIKASCSPAPAFHSPIMTGNNGSFSDLCFSFQLAKIPRLKSQVFVSIFFARARSQIK